MYKTGRHTNTKSGRHSLVRLATSPGAFLGEENGLDVRKHPALGNSHAGQQLVKLLVVPEKKIYRSRQKDVARTHNNQSKKQRQQKDRAKLLV